MERRSKRLGWRIARFASVWLALVVFVAGCASYDSAGAGNFHTVIVDAGHGGHDRGARARSGSPEKILALDTARRVARILRARGFRVIETRTSDYFVTLGRRVEIANRTPGAIFVSIHYNYARRVAARGLEVFYYSPRSRRLAANILREMLRSYPTENRGVKRGRYYVLRNNRRPAVLCELGFLTNPADNRYVQSSWYRQRLAERIAAGIVAESRGRSPR